MATIALVGVVQTSAESTTGWSAGALESELFYQGSHSIGAKVGSGTSSFVHTGTSRNFSPGGGEEGDHILVILNSLTAGKLDTKSNGGLRVRAGSNTADYGDWYVDGGDTKSPTTAFLPYIVNPESDFDAVGGAFTTTGNPAQMNTATTFGGVFKALSGIMGNFNNSLIDQITIGSGLRSTGTGGLLQDFITADEGTINNRYGFITTKDGIVYCQGKLYFGSSTSSVVFLDSNQVLVFQDVSVAPGFFEIVVEHPSSNVTMDAWVIKSSGNSKAVFNYISGIWIIKNGTIDTADTLSFSTGVTIENETIINSGQIKVDGATLNVVTVSNSNAVSAVLVETITDLANCSNLVFRNNGGHSIEIKVAGIYTFNNFQFFGGGANETTTADVYNSSGGAVTINPTNGGGTPTIRNAPGSTTTVNNTKAIRITGIPLGLEGRARRGAYSVLHDSNIQDGDFEYSFNYTLSKPITISVGGVADDGTAYERIERVLFESENDQIIPFDAFLNPSYI